MSEDLRFAIDVGTNSIGWCLLRLDRKGRPCSIFDAGVRIFSDGREPKSGEPLAVQRRNARLSRRRRDRYICRRKRLISLLVEVGLMPSDQSERNRLKSLNPYLLRVQALEGKIEPFQLGRAIYHINQRRGFKSNRKDFRKEKENKGNKERIVKLNEELRKRQCRTLGEYCFQRLKNRDSIRFKPGSDFYPHRDMYVHEFEEIRRIQEKYHPGVKEAAWDAIKQCIFFQRDLRAPVIGKCQFLVKEERASRALPSFQKFRILQDLENLIIVNSDRSKQLLSRSQKELLWEVLTRQKTLSFEKIKKILKLPEQTSFNLENAKQGALQGDETSSLLSRSNYFGTGWFKLTNEKQDSIVEQLLNIQNEDNLLQIAVNEWGLSKTNAEELADFSVEKLPEGHARFCAKVLLDLVRVMRGEGLNYAEAVKRLGFSHSEPGVELRNDLAYYGELLPASVVPAIGGSAEEIRWGRISNPTVHIGLNQLRKLVNALIERYGPPKEVVVELARELKLPEKVRVQIRKEQNRLKAIKDQIRKKLEEMDLPVNYDNILRFQLWEELSLVDCNDRKCPYCGGQIPVSQLFTPAIEIEHILPFSKTRDDSAANKIVSHAKCNRLKGDRSPFEAFGRDEARWEVILNQTYLLPGNKKWRFDPDAMERFQDEEGWLARQLNDTAYLAKIAKKYLSFICPSQHVWAVPGRLTALLRRHWGLNEILGKEGEKDRGDHRHHAIDALVVGLTDRRMLNDISRWNAGIIGKVKINEPWDNFRKEAWQKINSITVSHKQDHGKEGKLFEDTAYGLIMPRSWEAEKGFTLVSRKSILTLNKKAISEIRDDVIRKELLLLSENIDEKNLPEVLEKYSKDRGIHSVRVLEKRSSEYYWTVRHPSDAPRFSKALIPEDNLYADVWIYNNRIKVTGVCGIKALKGEMERPHPAAKKVMRLFKGDMVRIVRDNVEQTYRVASLRIANNQLALVPHNVGEKNPKTFAPSFNSISDMKVRKIYVDILGKVKDPGPIL